MYFNQHIANKRTDEKLTGHFRGAYIELLVQNEDKCKVFHSLTNEGF